MYNRIIYIKEQFLIEEMKSKKEIASWIASLKMQNYLLVMISDVPYEFIQKAIKEKFDTFICLNGQQIIFEGKAIRNQFLPLQVINDLLKISTHVKNALMLYKKQEIILVNKELTSNEYSKKGTLFFTSASKQPELSNVYLVKLFNSKKRKDIIYEDLFEQSLSFKRINEDFCIMGTLGITLAEAKSQLEQKISREEKIETCVIKDKSGLTFL